jgi:hypothetical protein
MDEKYPESVVAHGGIFAWHDGRENPDTFQALLAYPKGFLVSYSTSFGNDAPGYTRIMGKKATLFNTGGEGSPRWRIEEELGNHEQDNDVDQKRKRTDILLPGDKELPPMGIADEDLSHMTNWLDCLRTRKQPNATVQNGLSHSVACIMAARAYWSGQKMYFDTMTERIVDHPPAAPTRSEPSSSLRSGGGMSAADRSMSALPSRSGRTSAASTKPSPPTQGILADS